MNLRADFILAQNANTDGEKIEKYLNIIFFIFNIKKCNR